MKTGTFTFLGCGNSTGVPSIGNYWGQCDPKEPKNHRTRSSGHLQIGDISLVIDTGPDFRNQCNRENISKINSVLYTHCHGDHVNGIDELRIIRFRNKELVNIYGDQATIEDLSSRFPYMFHGGKSELYPPMLNANIISSEQYGFAMNIDGIDITPFEQDHGTIMTTGYRIGNLAYCLDMVSLSNKTIDSLKGIKIWIVDGAGYKNKDNLVHANIDNILKMNQAIGAEQIYLSSLTLEMDYATLIDELPNNVFPAYDGMKLNFML